MDIGGFDLVALVIAAFFYIYNSFVEKNVYLQNNGWPLGCPPVWLKNSMPYRVIAMVLLLLFLAVGIFLGLLEWWVYIALATGIYYFSENKGKQQALLYIQRERVLGEVYEELYGESDDSSDSGASTEYLAQTSQLDQVVREINRLLNYTVKDFNIEKKKLIKMAIVYGLSIGYLECEEANEYFFEKCKKQKISKSDAMAFKEFYDACEDNHIIFNITNEALAVAENISGDYEDSLDSLLQVVGEVADDPVFPESVSELHC